MTDANTTVDPVAAARLCLAGEQEMMALRIHEFPDDVAAHDGDLQDRLEREFAAAFDAASRALSDAFGAELGFPLDEVSESLPVSGVFAAATWNVEDQRVFLVAAHEDRETPFLLLVGVDRA